MKWSLAAKWISWCGRESLKCVHIELVDLHFKFFKMLRNVHSKPLEYFFVTKKNFSLWLFITTKQFFLLLLLLPPSPPKAVLEAGFIIEARNAIQSRRVERENDPSERASEKVSLNANCFLLSFREAKKVFIACNYKWKARGFITWNRDICSFTWKSVAKNVVMVTLLKLPDTWNYVANL